MSFVSFEARTVPKYLQSSLFFATLNEADDEAITLPAKHCKLDTAVASDCDLLHLLTTLQFWGSDEIPSELLDYFLANDLYQNTQILDELETEFTSAKFLRKLNTHDRQARTELALQEGSVPVLDYLLSRGYKLDCETACVNAIKCGKVDFLQYVHQLGGLLTHKANKTAIITNNCQCFQYCIEHDAPMDIFYYDLAAKQPTAEILRYMYEAGLANTYFLSQHLRTTVRHNSLECLRFIHGVGCELNASLLLHAAQHGSLDCFKYLSEQGCPRDRSICTVLAENGHLECLQYAHEQGYYWDSSVFVTAAERGRLDIIQYAHEQGCEWSEQVANAAARCNYPLILEYIALHGCPWSDNATSLACTHGNLECLRILHERGCPWNTACTRAAALNGHLEMLVYLHTNSCPWDTFATSYAAAGGHLEVLVYLHENGCPWNLYTTKRAAASGSKECLEYAITHGCRWDSSIYIIAKEHEHIECVEYLDAQRKTCCVC